MPADRSVDLARVTLQLLALGALIVTSCWIVRPRMTNATISADDALQRLIDGNEPFRSGATRFPTTQKEIRTRLTHGYRVDANESRHR